MEKEYRNRILDDVLEKYLKASGAVLIEGAKWCGKTTTANRHAGSNLFMQDPDRHASYMELSRVQPSLLLQGQTPHFIDEWQTAPNLWDAVRFEVDRRNDFGQFILTGSAVPGDLSEICHTGTGRIARLLMRPMTLFESGESSGKISLGELFSDKGDLYAENILQLEEISYLICRGGWPGAVMLGQRSPADALNTARMYVDAIVSQDVSRVDGVKRSAQKAMKLLRSYARSVASQAKIMSITQDVYSGELESPQEIAGRRNGISAYLDVLKRIFVVEDSEAWNPNLRSKTALRTSDTHYFSDPSIAAAALRIGPEDLIADLNTFGLLFENLCVRDLRVYAQMLDGDVYHYRDKNDLECDAVIHLKNGKYALVEIKAGGERAIEEAAATLAKLECLIDQDRMSAPVFKMVLTAVGAFAYRRNDGVLVVPIGTLGP